MAGYGQLSKEPIPNLNVWSGGGKRPLETKKMALRLGISAIVFMMVQAVLFGIGAVLILASPLASSAMWLLPWMIIATAIVSAPLSWWFAPRLRARYWRDQRGQHGVADKMINAIS